MAFVDPYVRAAYQQGVPALEACNACNSGAYLLETDPRAHYSHALR
jgi:hypothetical protein